MVAAKTSLVSGSSVLKQSSASRHSQYQSDFGRASRPPRTIQHPIGKSSVALLFEFVADFGGQCKGWRTSPAVPSAPSVYTSRVIQGGFTNWSAQELLPGAFRSSRSSFGARTPSQSYARSSCQVATSESSLFSQPVLVFFHSVPVDVLVATFCFPTSGCAVRVRGPP